MIIGKQEKECVVYKITNLVNGREYIGVSTQFLIRMKQHGREQKKILADIKKFNLNYEDNFDKEIIFQGTETECYSLEEKLVPKDKNKWPFYNSSMGGIRTYVPSHGEQHPKAIFTDIQVLEIRKRINIDSEKIPKIAKEFGVGVEAIRRILLSKHWKHVKGPTREASSDVCGENNGRSIILEKDIPTIRERGKNGEKPENISKDYNVKSVTITAILTGRNWPKAGGPIRNIDYTIKTKLSYDDIERIRIRCFMTKDSYLSISKESWCAIGDSQVGRIAKGLISIYRDAPGPILGKDYMKRGEGNV